jgi:hypothetical protein
MKPVASLAATGLDRCSSSFNPFMPSHPVSLRATASINQHANVLDETNSHRLSTDPVDFFNQFSRPAIQYPQPHKQYEFRSFNDTVV